MLRRLPTDGANPPGLGNPLVDLACLAILGAAFFLPYVALIPIWGSAGTGLLIPDGQRFFQYVALILELLVFVILIMRRQQLPWKRPLMPWLWLLLGTSGLVSSALATHLEQALLDWAWMNGLVIAVILTAWVFSQNPQSMRRMVAISALVSVFLYVLWFFVGNGDYLFSYDFRFVEPAILGFTNRRYFSDFQAALLFLAPFAWTMILAKSPWRWPAFVLIGLMYSLAAFVGSRSILLGQLAAHGILLVTYGKRYLPFLKTIAACWILGLSLYWGLFTEVSPWLQNYEKQQVNRSLKLYFDSSGRDRLLGKAWHLIEEHPVLGVGGRHFGCYVAEDFLDPKGFFDGDHAHPHNALVQLAVEWGVGQALLFAAIVVFLLNRLRRCLGESVAVDDFDSAMAGSLLALLAQAQVAGVLNGPASQAVLVLLLGWAVQRAFPLTMTGGSTVLGRRRTFLPWFTLVLAMVITLLFMSELLELPRINSQESFKNFPTTYASPRFWQQGWLLPLCGKI